MALMSCILLAKTYLFPPHSYRQCILIYGEFSDKRTISFQLKYLLVRYSISVIILFSWSTDFSILLNTFLFLFLLTMLIILARDVLTKGSLNHEQCFISPMVLASTSYPRILAIPVSMALFSSVSYSTYVRRSIFCLSRDSGEYYKNITLSSYHIAAVHEGCHQFISWDSSPFPNPYLESAGTTSNH